MNIFKNSPFLPEYRYRCKIRLEDKPMGYVFSEDLPPETDLSDVVFAKEDGVTLVEVPRVCFQSSYRWQIFRDNGAIWIYFNLKEGMVIK